MGKTQVAIVIVCLAALVGITAYGVFRPSVTVVPTTTKWEYRIAAIPDLEFESGMAKLGEEGWELIFARRATGGREEKPLYEVIFKRPKPADVEVARRTADDTKDSGSSAHAAVAKMEQFQQRMCECKDKACADTVNEDMTRWGTEMAKNASGKTNEKPDPELARKSADIMTKYTECMTRVMMAGR